MDSDACEIKSKEGWSYLTIDQALGLNTSGLMSKNPALRPGQAVGRSLRQAALAILGEARSALEGPLKADTVAIHDIRKSIKQWRALLRLCPLGDEALRLRLEARG